MATDNNNNEIDSIIVDKPKAVLKSYSVLMFIANILISVSTVGFTAVGAINKIDTTYLMVIILIMSSIGLAGRFIKQDISDTEIEGPVGFKGVSIRFVWFLENLAKSQYNSLITKVKGWFGK